MYRKRWCTLFIPVPLCEHPLGGNSFAVNTRIIYSGDGGVRRGEGSRVKGKREEERACYRRA